MDSLKKLLNLHEEATDLRLRNVSDKYGARVFPKVRLADVLPIENSGISDSDYRFALQAHFDFVVANATSTPLFGVEFDGPYHRNPEQKARDDTKDALCERFDFPLLRINSNYLQKKYRDMDLLSWFVEVWFAREWFDDAQKSGLLPYGEPFTPWSFTGIPGSDKPFPLCLSSQASNKMRKLFFDGKVKDFIPSHSVALSDDGTYRAIAFIRITADSGVMVETAMRAHSFVMSPQEGLSEIIVLQLYECLMEVLSGSTKAVPVQKIDKRVRSFDEKYRILVGARNCKNIDK